MEQKPHQHAPVLLRLLALLVFCILAGLLLKKSLILSNQPIFFGPAAGLTLAAALIFSPRFWPGLPLVGAIVLYVAEVPPGGRMAVTVAGNTLAAAVCAFILKRPLQFRGGFERVRELASFVLVAGGIGSALNVLVNCAGQWLLTHHATWAEVWSNAPIGFMQNAGGMLVWAPFLVVWAVPSLWRLDFRLAVEWLLCLALLVASSLVAFAAWFLNFQHDFLLAYLPVPFLLWGTFRFGPRGAATGTLVCRVLAMVFWIWEQKEVDSNLVNSQTIFEYFGALAVGNLLCGALTAGRRRAELRVAESENQLRMVVADQSELICRFRRDGTITFVNPAFCNFYDEIEPKLAGANFFERLPAAEAAMLRDRLNALEPGPPGWSFDCQASAADGRAEWLDYSFRRFAHPDNLGSEYQAVIQKITARKRAELALQETKRSLEQVNLKLQMSANEARAAAHDAERANIAKSEFLANMSHEIRTPLSGVLGMIELLSQSRLDVRQREFAASAAESANALLRVINDVLDFSKIEAGKMTIAQEEFSLRKIVDGVLENAAAREPGKKITLAAVVRRSIPAQLVGDPLRLRQVLLNLTGNGVKFTDRGEVIVRVQPVFHTHGRIKLRFEVRDTGIGLAEDQVNKLFQPFVQVDASSARKFGGSGLGLAISRKLVELMGGRIGVNSGIGQGSTFWFELPFAVPPQPPLARHFPGLVFAQVLVAAPNAGFRESLVERLRGWGVDCHEAAAVAELSHALRHGFGSAVLPVVLCDDEMLALGGPGLRQLLADKHGGIQCLLLAGPTSDLEGGDDDVALFASVLLKPVREDSLFDALVGCVTGRHAGETRPAVSGETQFLLRPAAVRHTPVSGLRILVAEDHPFNRKLCQLMLDSFGARADWAANGREAVEKFSAGRYDAILMDGNMPEMDGHEAAAAIRQLEAEKGLPRVRIIALTANALAGEREKCLAAGMDDYLSKPFTSQQLYQSLLATVPAPAAAPDGFDPARVEQLVQEMGRVPVVEMAGDFLAELPDRLHEIRRLHAAAQWPEARRAAHSLRGLFLMFGCPALAEKIQGIEEAAGLADAAKAAAALEGLEPQAEAAANRLRDWLKNRPTGTVD